MKSLILALLLSSTAEAAHQHHRHQPHNEVLAQFDTHTKKPTYDQLLALNSVERENQNIQIKTGQKEKGILDKV